MVLWSEEVEKRRRGRGVWMNDMEGEGVETEQEREERGIQIY